MKTRLTFKIRAGAKETKFAGKVGDVWKLQVAAPPVDGKANEAITRYLAKLCCIPCADVCLVQGFTSALKVIEFTGVSRDAIERVILEAHGS